MKVLVATCVWPLALNKNKQPVLNLELVEFQTLIEEVRVQLMGPIRQEILSEIKRKLQFLKPMIANKMILDILPLSPFI